VETALGLLRGVAIGIGVIIVALFAFGGPEGIVALVAKSNLSHQQAEVVDEADAPAAENPEEAEAPVGEPWEDHPAVEEETTIIE
jgi:hypothetical protein